VRRVRSSLRKHLRNQKNDRQALPPGSGPPSGREQPQPAVVDPHSKQFRSYDWLKATIPRIIVADDQWTGLKDLLDFGRRIMRKGAPNSKSRVDDYGH
jgi:hypothetical protein